VISIDQNDEEGGIVEVKRSRINVIKAIGNILARFLFQRGYLSWALITQNQAILVKLVF
jgi:hypothetical protein